MIFFETSKNFQNPLIFIVGPTGVGKSELAFSSALKYGGQIVNADSLQVYQSLSIGTNQPSHDEKLRVPHYLFGFVKEEVQYTAGAYRKKALSLIQEEILKTFILVTGGSGFYIQALEKGLFPTIRVPSEIKSELELELKKKGLRALFEEIEKKDPLYAKKIKPNDSYRIMRSLSFIRFSRKKMSDLEKEEKLKPLPFSSLKLGLFLEREELRETLLLRTEKMLEEGLLEETKDLVQRGLSFSHVMKSVGYKECFDFLNLNFSKEELIQRILTRNMRLAKKQMTWFKRDQSIQWFHARREVKKAFERIRIEVESKL